MARAKWLAIAMALMGIGVVMPQDYPCDVYMRSAKIYLNRSNPDYESALKNLEAGYQKCYEDPILHELMGRIYADQGIVDKMVVEFKIAKEKGHPKAEDMNKVIESMWGKEFQNGTNILEQMEKAPSDSVRLILTRQAGRHFENCILIDSSKYQPYVNAAAQHIDLNELEKADTLLSRVYQLVPESLEVVLSYGINLYNLQKYDQAIEIFEKAVKLDPNNREALTNLASLYGLKGDRQKSMEIWDILIEKGMADKDVYFNRGFVHLAESEELVRQTRALEDSLKEKPKAAELKAQIESLKSKKKTVLAEANFDFTKCTELDSADTEALYYLGYIQLLQEDLDKAMKTLEKVTTRDEGHKAAWARLAIIYTLKGMKEKAQEADAKSQG